MYNYNLLFPLPQKVSRFGPATSLLLHFPVVVFGCTLRTAEFNASRIVLHVRARSGFGDASITGSGLSITRAALANQNVTF